MHAMKDAVQYLSRKWKSCGVEVGDTILIHSSIKRTLYEARNFGYLDITPKVILDSFIHSVGGNGTLLFPLFNFDFTKGVPFDIRSTPSQMGALTECARTSPGAVRTGHPIYSFAVIGKRAEDFRTINNESGYGADSPFALLREMNGKIGVLDLPDQNSMTFYHHMEEMCLVDYRYFKKFSADYTGYEGLTASRTYSLFVRNLERGILTSVDRAGELLWSERLYSGERPLVGAGLRTIVAREMFERIVRLIQAGDAGQFLYEEA